MKKQNILNLVKYHVEGNESAFRNEVTLIASEFDKAGDYELAMYLMNLVSDSNVLVPQDVLINRFEFLRLEKKHSTHLQLPTDITDDIVGIINANEKNAGINKFIFYGAPGTGKTASVFSIAKVLQKEVLSVNIASLIDSKLGETSKNVIKLFNEIKEIKNNHYIILLDELDALVLNRTDQTDVREMARVTSTFMKEIEELSGNILLFATTNLYKNIDLALKRRFDAAINFDRYSKEDLIKIAISYLKTLLSNDGYAKSNTKLIRKIFDNCKNMPMPGELLNIIKTSVGFSSKDNESEYIKRLFYSLYPEVNMNDFEKVSSLGFSLRETEMLTSISKSTIARKIK